MTLFGSEKIAEAFHEAYERLAPHHGYATREESAKPWEDVPEQNKGLMVAVVDDLLARGIIFAPLGIEESGGEVTPISPRAADTA